MWRLIVKKLKNNTDRLSGNESLLVRLLGLGVLALACSLAIAQDTGRIELNFGMLNTDGMVEQDVFMANPTNANQVRRIPVSQVASHMNTALYSSAVEPPYEPMKTAPTETYPMGAMLSLTLGDWLKATGSGSYVCKGLKATLKASFRNLVPDGVYTMWNFIDLDPPTDPYQGLLMPVGKRDGSQAIFKADAKGNASFDQVVEPCPQLSDTQSMAGLAIAWHSDGKTYGFTPGGLGVVSHAQLMAVFPRAGKMP